MSVTELPSLPGRDRTASEQLPYTLNVRLTTPQRLYLQIVAETHDVKVSQALRLVIDAAIAQNVEDNRQPDGTRNDPFGIVVDFQPSAEWLERHGEQL